MTNSQISSEKRSKKVPKGLLALALIVSFVGFSDAAYLAFEHYRGGVVPCDLTGGCETVLASAYATVLGVPVSLLGALYYLVLFFAAIVFASSGDRRIATAASWLTLGGFGASIYFVYLQLFVLEAICPYCMTSAASSTVLFVLGFIFLKNRRAVQ